ncbi:hypothetical protein Thi970DRAFT_01898 [Thiorhodovibrio frisius]|uniref:Uncharacterized protein n=1 Tax=Thiorhodovibrio frisius TaxID=631362 RepID=H8Z2U1_9GAMM|nr:hypothetical protein Thi970DRAFT_01898 [Thiorhodovibrio frisius]WPL21645.1 hypothetical protein Thiofri_01771 [Thiorhodovibrio frisius]
MKRARDSSSWWEGQTLNCLQLNIGNFKVWISAFCVFEEKGQGIYTEDEDDLVELSAPGLTCLVWEHAPFGRIKDGNFCPSVPKAQGSIFSTNHSRSVQTARIYSY